MNSRRYAPALLMVGSLLIVPVVHAQDAEDMPADTVVVQSNKVVIKTPDGQKIYVYTDDGDTGARVFVGDPGDDHGLRMWRGVAPDVRFRHFDADHPRAFVFGDDGEGFDFDFDMPEIEPLLEGLGGMRRMRLELGMSTEERAEIARMDAETHRLAREARRAEGAERQRLERELREELETIFERKLELRSKHIETLEDRLNEERETLEERRQSRNEIIERRLRDLLGEDDALDW